MPRRLGLGLIVLFTLIGGFLMARELRDRVFAPSLRQALSDFRELA